MGAKKAKAVLALSDGMIFEGWSCGAEGESAGEVVFNTSMTGYQEILTDASYRGQIVVMTYSQIGNYGINTRDIESGNPEAAGFVMKECFKYASNWRSEMSLPEYLRGNGIVSIEGIDTRALTQHIRDYGAQTGIISTIDPDPESLVEKAKQYPGISSFDLVKDVTTKKPYKWKESLWKWQATETDPGKVKPTDWLNITSLFQRFVTPPRKKIIVYDFGVKFNILRHLADTGCDITVVPAATPAEDVIEKADGIVLSNGPGDPQTVTYAIKTAKNLIGKKPLLGICLGHQILGLALGGRTYKLKFGHHGGNHPVMDLSTRKVEITSQNHNYCVDMESIRDKVELTHRNLYDGTEEGMRHKDVPLLSLQYHPEAGPGPNDSCYIFKRFRDMIDKW
ncbi:carbamoyl-phosphate synthase small chain [bacterium BMS3Bbin08]|nr:carbamoyl-phosphate synthase small chain [bacterium BMS3Bbin08]